MRYFLQGKHLDWKKAEESGFQLPENITSKLSGIISFWMIYEYIHRLYRHIYCL